MVSLRGGATQAGEATNGEGYDYDLIVIGGGRFVAGRLVCVWTRCVCGASGAGVARW